MNLNISNLVDKIRVDKKRAVIIAGAAVVVLVLIILAASGGKMGLLAKGAENLMQADSFHTKTQLILNLPVQLGNRERPIVGVVTTLDGDFSYEDERPVFSGQLDMQARGQGMLLFTKGEVRLLPDQVAFRLNELPALLNPKGNLVEHWTYVDAPVMTTNNKEEVTAAMVGIFEGMTVVDKKDGMVHYAREITPEQEEILSEIFRQNRSGNRALHVVTRLMRAFEVSGLDVWVDKSDKQIVKIETTFVSGEEAEERAFLAMEFSEYNKKVEVDRPEEELTVRPDVFAGIFGRGEVEGL